MDGEFGLKGRYVALFGPGDGACEARPYYTQEVHATGPGAYEATSGPVYESSTYHWVVEYSGDATNSPVATGCADPEAELFVLKGAPTISSEGSAPVSLGENIQGIATLSGGSAYPQGMVTFNFYGPDDATCSAAPAFSFEEEAYGDYAYYSPESTPTEAGYYFWVAEYSGDSQNESVTDLCGESEETH